jgi:hypothetical protein
VKVDVRLASRHGSLSRYRVRCSHYRPPLEGVLGAPLAPLSFRRTDGSPNWLRGFRLSQGRSLQPALREAAGWALSSMQVPC